MPLATLIPVHPSPLSWGIFSVVVAALGSACHTKDTELLGQARASCNAVWDEEDPGHPCCFSPRAWVASHKV